MSDKYGIRKSFEFGLKEWGHDFKIWHRTSTPCTCGSTTDPFYGTHMRSNCATCDGSGLEWNSTARNCKGVLEQFPKNRQYIEDGQFIHGVMPDGMAYATFWLDDVLINHHSPTGDTYFTNCVTVEAMGYKYKPKNTERVGIDENWSIIVTLNKIEA